MVKLYFQKSGSEDSKGWISYYKQDVVSILLEEAKGRLVLNCTTNTLLTPDTFLTIKEEDSIKVLPLVGGG